MGLIDQAWLIPALPLASFIVIVFFTRVMDVRVRRAAAPAAAADAGHSSGLSHAEAEGADHAPADQHGASADSHAADAAQGGHGSASSATHEDDAHGAHGS